MPRVVSLCMAVALWVGSPGVGAADILTLASGRSVSVRAYRVEGARAILTLRGGGEVVCHAALVVRVAPDELPYPDPDEAASTPDPVTPEPFGGLIEPLAARHAVDATLVRAVVEAESGYEPTARSAKGALGLMQLMPATARQYALRDPLDPRANLDAGIRHLRGLLDRYPLAIALAAYNAGEGAIARYGGIPPFRETREYVARVLRRAGLGGSRAWAPSGARGRGPAMAIRPQS